MTQYNDMTAARRYHINDSVISTHCARVHPRYWKEAKGGCGIRQTAVPYVYVCNIRVAYRNIGNI